MIERQILVFQLLEVAQHLGFAVVGIEHRMAQIGRGSSERFGNAANQGFSVQFVNAEPMIGPQEHIEQLRHGAFVAGFVEA
ncbi:hypothetical protein D3C84_937310 [compost metagenome]